MKFQAKILAAVLFPIVILGLWAGGLQYELYHGHPVRLPASGYDPRDLISGHYLELQINWDEADCSQFADNVCPKEEFLKSYRYYLNEHAALELEREIMNRNPVMELEFIIAEGQSPQLKELYIDELLWQNWLLR